VAFGLRRTLWTARLPGLRRLWPLGKRARAAQSQPPPDDADLPAPDDVAFEKVDEAASTLVATGALENRHDALIALRSAVDSALEEETAELEEKPVLALAAPPPVEYAPRPNPVRRFLLAFSGRRIRVRKTRGF